MGKGCIVIGAAMLDIVMEIDQIPNPEQMSMPRDNP